MNLKAGETVLDALLANGIHMAHSCKAGACGSCMMRAVGGAIPARSQVGLKDSWRVQGYFLPCVCLPETDLSIAPAGSDAQCGASIMALEPLSPDVLRVCLRCDRPIGFRAGQFVVLLVGKLARSYSIACLPGASPDASELELHVRIIPNGQMSSWLRNTAQPGDRVTIMGPSGECFYVAGNEDQPMLLAGTGTGLAPLYGILLDALHHGHRGPIHLFHGGLHAGGLYLVNELRRLAEEHSQFKYTPAVLNGPAGETGATGSIEKVILERLPNLKGWRACVCGDPSIVALLKKQIFLAGAASRDIQSDAFVPAAQTAA